MPSDKVCGAAIGKNFIAAHDTSVLYQMFSSNLLAARGGLVVLFIEKYLNECRALNIVWVYFIT